MNRFYFRTGDSRHVQRYRCRRCKGRPSDAAGTRWFRAKKRRLHESLRKRFAKLGSLRGEAEVLGVNRKTAARKLVILGEIARENLERENRKKEPTRVIPLFSLSHTCASTRMSVTRLLRRTWYTTKRADRLKAHLFLYADYHSQRREKKLNR